MDAIRMERVTKFYGKNIGIQDISITVPEGSIFGFLGPNGAGKTTAIRCLLDTIRPSSGKMFIFDESVSPTYPAAIRQRIGCLPGELRLYEELTGARYLQLIGDFYGRVEEHYRERLCAVLGLTTKDLRRKIEQYSRGMKQKIGILQAMQHDPDLLILDEPTEGLDPLIRSRFYDLIRERADAGRTIFMSSHNLAEVERVCQEVAILRKGELLTATTVDNLKEMSRYTVEIVFASEAEAATFTLEQASIEGTGARRTLLWQGPFAPLFQALSQCTVLDFTCRKADLEDIFITFYESEGDTRGQSNP